MLSADYAHDLKIAVQMMISCAQMIELEVNKAAPQAGEYARMLVENGWDAVRYLQNALDERCAAYFAVNARESNAVETVRRAVERFAPLAGQAGIRLSFEPACTQALFAYDEEKLTRITMNLVSNAMKHARECVTVHAGVSGTYFELNVEDDGEGFTQDPFARPYRADGNGVGLAEVTHFAALHGGNVQALRIDGRTHFAVRLKTA